MNTDPFYRNNRMTALLEYSLNRFDTYDDFEKEFPEEFLDADTRIGDYLAHLL